MRYLYEFEDAAGWIVGEGVNRSIPVSQLSFDIAGGTIAQTQPDNFGRKPTQHTYIAEVGVFRDDDVVVGIMATEIQTLYWADER